jgi:hypothetical protein
MSTGLSDTKLTLNDAYKLYEDGKHRRYSLLFSVNGGAFALAKLLTGEPGKVGVVLGKLTLEQLAVGMVAFTAIMVVDIYFFGEKMRREYKAANFFGPQGKVVLILLGLLVCGGWYLAGGRGVLP